MCLTRRIPWALCIVSVQSSEKQGISVPVIKPLVMSPLLMTDLPSTVCNVCARVCVCV